MPNHFQYVQNSEVQERQMLTGKHMVRDVFCKNCSKKLGWMYEFASDKTQIYKEGKVILEKALISEKDSNIENS